MNDGYEVGGVAGLGVEDFFALLIVIEGYEGEGGIFSDGLAGVFQGELGGGDSGVGGVDIGALRGAIDERAGVEGEEGRRVLAVAVRLAETGSGVQGGDVDVFGLGEGGRGFSGVRLGQLDAGIVGEGQVYGGGEGDLGSGRDRRKERGGGKKEAGECGRDEEPGSGGSSGGSWRLFDDQPVG